MASCRKRASIWPSSIYLRLNRGVVALTKSDLVDADRIGAVIADIAALLVGTGLEGSEIIPVWASTGQGLDALTEKLDAACTAAPARAADGRFRLAVDRCFTPPVSARPSTGTVLSGTVRVGDEVIVSPSGLEARIRSINAQNRPVEQGVGQRCALVLSGPEIAKTTVHRGDVIVDPAIHEPTARIDATLRILPPSRAPSASGFQSRCITRQPRSRVASSCLGDKPIAPSRA